MKKKTKRETKAYEDCKQSYTTSVTYDCPVRGKVTQIVTVNKYPSNPTPDNTFTDPLVSELLDELNENGYHEIET